MTHDLRQTLASKPDDVRGWTQLGDWLFTQALYAECESAYRQALQTSAMHARAQEGLGLALLRQGRLEEAHRHLELAHKADANNADILIHWGLVDLELGNLARAAERFQEAIDRVPNNAHAWHNLALVALKQGAVEQSIALLQRAIELKPDHGLAYSNLAMALRRNDQLQPALQAAHKATKLKRNNARVWVVLADMQMNLGDFQSAQGSLAQAEQIDPRHIGLHVARGKLHMALGEHAQARQAFDLALSIDSSNADAQGGLGELQLLLGEWATGWDLYEARCRVEATPVRRYPYPAWEGQALQGKTVLIHAEQGMGDIILFASCLGNLIERGAHCVIEVRQRMVELFSRSFPEAQVIGRAANAPLLEWPDGMPAIDYQLPFGSLPRWFRRDGGSFPKGRPAYLRAEPSKVANWQQALRSDERKSIGIAWRGGVAGTAKLQRSMSLLDLVQALPSPDVRLVCLQYGEVDEELRHAEAATGVSVHAGLSGLANLDDLAALTAACDGVITVCSTQAHLTGALGLPGLVLVPSNPSWRYLHDGEQMPWYPSLMLARQSTPGDWQSALSSARRWVEQLPAASSKA